MGTTCTGCNAPTNPAAMACEYCGAVLGKPTSVDEELAMVREQSSAAQRIANPAKSDSPLELFNATQRWRNNLENLTNHWTNAFIPTSPPARVAALNACAAAAPAATVNTAEGVKPLLGTLKTRAEVLAATLIVHPNGTAADRAVAERVTKMLDERTKEVNKANVLLWKWIGAAIAVVFLLPFGIILLSAKCSGVGGPEDMCRTREGAKQQAGCLEACSQGKQWACQMAETLKSNDAEGNKKRR